MRARVVTQNKKYLVEFKSDEQMITFLTNHGHKIQKFDIISENEVPAMKKSFEMQKVSQPTGWKTIEKSSIVNKEKDVDTKCMKLGGKYNTFKYEPDASLESNTSNKNSDGSIDSPALNGNEPKAKSVEDTKEFKNNSHKTEETEEKEETDKEKVSEGVKDYLPRGGFIKDDETGHKEGIWGGQGTDEQIRKAKLIARVKHANGDRMGRVTKEDLDNYEYYLEQYQEIFGLDESDEEIFESENEVVWGDIIDWANKSFTDLYVLSNANKSSFKSRIKGIVECLAGAAAYAWDEPIENIKKRLFSSGLMQIDSDDNVTKSLNKDMDKTQFEKINSKVINESDDEETKHYEDDNEFEKTHECSWCGEEFPESDMKCEKDMGWLCNHDWKYLETREGNLEECDPRQKLV